MPGSVPLGLFIPMPVFSTTALTFSTWWPHLAQRIRETLQKRLWPLTFTVVTETPSVGPMKAGTARPWANYFGASTSPLPLCPPYSLLHRTGSAEDLGWCWREWGLSVNEAVHAQCPAHRQRTRSTRTSCPEPPFPLPFPHIGQHGVTQAMGGDLCSLAFAQTPLPSPTTIMDKG